MNQGIIRLTRHLVAASFFLAALTHQASGQLLRHKSSWGMFVRPGFTKGLSANANTISDPNYLTGGLGIYDLIRIRDTPAKIPFYFIKAEIGFNKRTGLFDVEGFGPACIRSSVIDLSLVLPLSLTISETVRANAGIGGSLGYRTSSNAESVTGTLPVVPGSDWRTGFILDVGFIVDANSTAIFGFRTLLESNTYACVEYGLYLGFGFSRKSQ